MHFKNDISIDGNMPIKSTAYSEYDSAQVKS